MDIVISVDAFVVVVAVINIVGICFLSDVFSSSRKV